MSYSFSARATFLLCECGNAGKQQQCRHKATYIHYSKQFIRLVATKLRNYFKKVRCMHHQKQPSTERQVLRASPMPTEKGVQIPCTP